MISNSSLYNSLISIKVNNYFVNYILHLFYLSFNIFFKNGRRKLLFHLNQCLNLLYQYTTTMNI